MVNYNKSIKVKLAMLDKTQEELRQALEARGYEVKASTLSKWILGQRVPQNSSVMAEIHLILAKWEREQEMLNKKE